MKTIFTIILGLILFSSYSLSNDKIINQSEFENKTIFIDVNSYKILQFEKRIRDVQITNSENVVAEFLENRENPLTRLKVYAKEISNESAIITFQDSSIITIGFNIVPHLKNIIHMAEISYPGLKVDQINDTIFLKGKVENQKDRDKILEMFAKFDVDPEKKVVDMLSTSNPKMIRIKLYAVEIDNDKGLDIKNNWASSARNHTALRVEDDKYSYYTSDYFHEDIAQANPAITGALDDIMANAVTLTGGLTGAANFMSEYFNTSLTLQYLADEGVANVLDESTLITLENQEAKFDAGGEIYVRLESDEKAELQTLKYGLELTLTAKEVMNDEFVHLNVTTKSRELDWANQVDSIPAITNKSINTTVIVKDKATVILGGLVNNSNQKDIDKIPLLGDIPILGALFKSSSFKEGKSELVFFITPEIVKAVENNQLEQFNANRKKMFERKDKDVKQKYLEVFNLDGLVDSPSEKKLDKIDQPMKKSDELKIKEVEPKMTNKTVKVKSEAKKLSEQEKRRQQVNKILYGE